MGAAVTLRRYAPMKPSAGTRIPDVVRREVVLRDSGCVGPRIGMPVDCVNGVELDHVRAGGMGMKSPSTADNLVSMCPSHHRMKTLEGRRWRPRLLGYLATAGVGSSAAHLDE